MDFDHLFVCGQIIKFDNFTPKLLYFSVILLTVSVCVFGAKAHTDHGAVVIAKQGDLSPLFGWSYWVAVGAGVMGLFSSCLYFCAGRKERTYYD